MKWSDLSAVVMIIGLIVSGWLLPSGWNGVIVAALLCVFLCYLGLRISNRPTGILINQRNLMSLSRFQAVLWTILLLSGYFTMALVRVRAWLREPSSVPDPLAIGIDGHLWALLGISTASLVGSPLLAVTKRTKEPDQAAVTKAAAALGEPAKDLNENREGILYGNPNIRDATFTDMFQGDEVADTAHIDLAKVQMFFFSVVAVICYAVMLFNQIRLGDSNPAALAEFPKVSDGLIALLGISHAGYLTKKGISQTKVQ